MRVLHVVEALGGGISVALERYISTTSEYDHVVLGSRRSGAHTGDRIGQCVPLLPLPNSGHVARVQAVVAAIDTIRPDVVHGHSSFGGVYARVAASIRRIPVVYTPHCYAFERRDVALALRVVYATTEAALGLVTDGVLAVSPREAMLARRLNRASVVQYVPHVADPVRSPTAAFFGGTALVVVAAGRVCPQKDPTFFAEVARAASRLAPGETEWRWLGGGEQTLENHLRRAGVSVSGWLSRARLLKALQECHVYLHSAAWEGAPLSVFEAASFGLPVVVRDIPATRSLGLGDGQTPAELAKAVLALRNPAAFDKQAGESLLWASRFGPSAQHEALVGAYSRVLDRRGHGVARTHEESACAS